MTENESLEKQIAEDLSAVVKEAKIMGCKEVQNFRHIPLENVETVIQALEENQQYHAIGTVEELQALKEKAEPKKPISATVAKDKNKAVGKIGKCPCCDSIVAEDMLWCEDCGQKLDWSEEE